MTASSKPKRRARPRDAASLVVYREGRTPEVLLGRRPPRQRFMPDVWVFPGGRVDPRDAALPVAAGLRPEVAEAVPAGAREARALAVGAVRETFEETGLLFGRSESGRIRPDLSTLEYVARAITPAQNPIRYHARFFLAERSGATGRIRSNGELLDIRWLQIEEALELPIIDVTAAVLRAVQRRLAGERPARRPFIRYRGGRPMIRYE